MSGGRPAPILPPSRTLSAEERARVLRKLDALLGAMLFQPGTEADQEAVAQIRFGVRLGRVRLADVPRLTRLFERWGIE